MRGEVSGHVGDAALLQALDGEADATTRAAIDAHLAACAACRARDLALRADVAAVGAAVSGGAAAQDAPAPPFTWDDVRRRAGRVPNARRGPPARRRAGWSAVWRVAAGVAALAGVAAAAPAAIRWARAHQAAARGAGVASRRTPGATASAPAAGESTAATVEFPLRGDTLQVAFETAQAAGALDLVAGAAGAAVVRVDVRGDRGAARLLVLPTGVRVRNLPTGTASYRVAVPGHVRAVRIEVGPRRVSVVPSTRVAAGPVRVALAPSRP